MHVTYVEHIVKITLLLQGLQTLELFLHWVALRLLVEQIELLDNLINYMYFGFLLPE